MANLFPTGSLNGSINTQPKEDFEFKCTYAFDFESGEFIKNADGSIKILNEFEAYVQWCQKAMLTSRYKCSAYSDRFGKDIIGSNLDNKAIELELIRTTKEALLVHPMTSNVDNFEFEWKDSEVYYTYKVISTTGESKVLAANEKVG